MLKLLSMTGAPLITRKKHLKIFENSHMRDLRAISQAMTITLTKGASKFKHIRTINCVYKCLPRLCLSLFDRDCQAKAVIF